MSDAQLPEPVAELLAAIADSLDLPLPSLDPADEVAHAGLLSDRAARVRNAALLILEDGHPIGRAAQWIREEADARPVTYTPWKRPETGEAAPC
ncbi:hypothetical protein ACIRQP_03515 [Streptomyces sp. NPDC102274]|uniref:hypothetical protein n=1 Tax=Streptomyces sp. NPDC102274 TaxID=3366151 RepID=UPI00382CCD14